MFTCPLLQNAQTNSGDFLIDLLVAYYEKEEEK